jgi:D-alanyl-D-alanine-carboxypeptidase/D-alanyl-D-alanine-endopeptidase
MKKFPWIAAISLAILLSGCGGDDNDTPPSSPPSNPPSAFAQVDAAAQTAFTTEGISGMGLAIYNAQGEKVFEKMYGDFHPDQRVAIASASKLVSCLTLFRLIDQGYLSLESTTGDLLGWQGEKGSIQLRHLLSFTSECVAEIEASASLAAPGVQFDYGSTHLAVAGLMAEVITGDHWNDIFQQQLAEPLGLADSIVYYAQPLSSSNPANPLLAGGLRLSMNDYEPILRLLFNEGVVDDQQFISAELMVAQAQTPYPNSIIGNTPSVIESLRYGFTAWLECATPDTGCEILSSPGAFGFTPWVDKAAGYYAILGMQYGVVAHQGFGVQLERSLQPLIAEAMRQ